MIKTTRNRRVKPPKMTAIHCLTAWAYSVQSSGSKRRKKREPPDPTDGPDIAYVANFDSDSRVIYVDNCASRSITNSKADCVTEPELCPDKRINGFDGPSGAKVYTATIRWSFEDDQGRQHTFDIPDSLYVPTSPQRILSPQHWAKFNGSRRNRTTKCVTLWNEVRLEWGRGQFRKSIALDYDGHNVGVIHDSPGYELYATYCTELGEHGPSEENPIALPANIIEPDDAGDITRYREAATEDENDEPQPPSDDKFTEELFPVRDAPLQTDFGPTDTAPEGAPTVISDEEERDPREDMAELLKMHHRLGHMPFAKIRRLAELGVIPAKYKHARIPLCTACVYGKMTRRPWRTKAEPKGRTMALTRPGQCVSVDQLISTTPGLIAQLRGKPTSDRYRAATVFVDQYSGYSHVVPQRSTSAEDTIEAKRQFEAFAETCGVKVTHYHADNGIFADNKWRAALRDDRQTLSFCGVNAHFQNGVAERRIRELQDSARTMLVHAQRRWPDAIDSHLWPYALRYANDMFNGAPFAANDHKVPLAEFSKAYVNFNWRDTHTFGAPTYVLLNELQAGGKTDKWAERARTGIFLGYSPLHARTVPLILSLASGLTSPQFHVKVDDGFQTVRGGTTTKSYWQERCGFRPPTSDPAGPEGGKKSERKVRLDHGGSPVGNNLGVGGSARGGEQTAPTARQEASEEPRVQIFTPDGTTDPGLGGSAPGDTGRPTRARRPPSRFADYETVLDALCQPTMAMASTSDPDTMYWHEAMKQPDKEQFIEASIK